MVGLSFLGRRGGGREKPRAGIYPTFTWEFSDVRRPNNRVGIHPNKVEGKSSSATAVAGSRRPDATKFFFGARGHEYVLLNVEVNELSLTKRVARKIARMSCRLRNRVLLLSCFIKINSSKLLSENNNMHEMRSVKQYGLMCST